MPRVSDDHAGFGPRCRGLYERLLRSRCEARCLPDPRRLLDAPEGEWEAEKRRGMLAAETLLAKRLAEAKPIIAPVYSVVGGHHGIPRDEMPATWWGVSWFVVDADDTVQPAEAPASEFAHENGPQHAR